MTHYPQTISAAFDQTDELRRLRSALRTWAAAHRAYHRPETIREPDAGPRITRREYLDAERALLAVAEEGQT